MKMKFILNLCLISMISMPTVVFALDMGGAEMKAVSEGDKIAKEAAAPTIIFVCKYRMLRAIVGQTPEGFATDVAGTSGCGVVVESLWRNYALCITEVSAKSVQEANDAVDTFGVAHASKDQVVCTPKEAAAAAAAAAVKPPAKCVVKKSTAAPAGIGQLNLSGLSPECMACGDCKLDDIVQTGAAFANLLTQLSAAFFFATFVYGGAMYLLSFGDKGRVDKGKKAITGAAIGMLIVLMAWTVVNYIANSLKGK